MLIENFIVEIELVRIICALQRTLEKNPFIKAKRKNYQKYRYHAVFPSIINTNLASSDYEENRKKDAQAIGYCKQARRTGKYANEDRYAVHLDLRK
jgi:hypothetical protein